MFINKQRFFFDFLHFFIDCLVLDDCNLILGGCAFPILYFYRCCILSFFIVKLSSLSAKCIDCGKEDATNG